MYRSYKEYMGIRKELIKNPSGYPNNHHNWHSTDSSDSSSSHSYSFDDGHIKNLTLICNIEGDSSDSSQDIATEPYIRIDTIDGKEKLLEGKNTIVIYIDSEYPDSHRKKEARMIDNDTLLLKQLGNSRSAVSGLRQWDSRTELVFERLHVSFSYMLNGMTL